MTIELVIFIKFVVTFILIIVIISVLIGHHSLPFAKGLNYIIPQTRVTPRSPADCATPARNIAALRVLAGATS
jgi:hypothetical protein